MAIDWRAVGPPHVSTGTGPMVFPNTWTPNFQVVQSQCTHHISGETVVYDDGVLAGYCETCSERITLAALPAGDIPARVRGLLAELMPAEGVPEGLEARIKKLRLDMEALSDALDESRELLRVIDSVIAQRQ